MGEVSNWESELVARQPKELLELVKQFVRTIEESAETQASIKKVFSDEEPLSAEISVAGLLSVRVDLADLSIDARQALFAGTGKSCALRYISNVKGLFQVAGALHQQALALDEEEEASDG